MVLRRWLSDLEIPRGIGLWRKLVRVCVCKGWAVHGIIFEYQGGKRSGILLTNSGAEMGLDDASIASRGALHTWRDVQPGDYLVRISGNQLSGDDMYLCHSLNLHFASGKTLAFASEHLAWKGESFSRSINQPFLVNSLAFDTKLGFQSCQGSVTSIHLPITQATAGNLPSQCKKKLRLILDLTDQLDSGRIVTGADRDIGRDAWWTMLGFLTGYDLLDDAQNCKLYIADLRRRRSQQGSSGRAPRRRRLRRAANS